MMTLLVSSFLCVQIGFLYIVILLICPVSLNTVFLRGLSSFFLYYLSTYPSHQRLTWQIDKLPFAASATCAALWDPWKPMRRKGWWEGNAGADGKWSCFTAAANKLPAVQKQFCSHFTVKWTILAKFYKCVLGQVLSYNDLNCGLPSPIV